MNFNQPAVVCYLYGQWPEDAPYLAGEYVKRLYLAVQRNTSVPHDFWVITDMRCWEYVSRFLGHRDVHHSFLPVWWEGLQWNLKKVYMYDKDSGLRRYPWVLCLDLDVVITGNIDFLLERRKKAFVTCRGAYKDDIGGSIIGFDPQWNHIDGLPLYLKHNQHQVEFSTKGSERKFLQRAVSNCIIPQPQYWQDLEPGKVLSYKVDGYREEASVVRFHGSPRPHELAHLPWMEKNWRAGNGAH